MGESGWLGAARSAHQGKRPRSTLPPLKMMPTRRSAAGMLPASKAARGTAAEGSMTSLSVSHARRMAAAISSSVTRAIPASRGRSKANVRVLSAVRRPSAMVVPLPVVMRWPASRERAASSALAG